MGTTGIAWSILAAVTATCLVVLVRTRWLQSRTLAKCVALSVLLHGALAVVCAFVGGWAPASWGRNEEGRMSIVVAVAEEPLDAPAVDSSSPHVEPAADQHASAASAAVPDVPAIPLLPAQGEAAVAPVDHVPLLDVAVESQIAPSSPAASAEDGADGEVRPDAPTHRVPDTYADRVGARRATAAAARGGSEATERAVQSALAWLAAAQAADGRWNAAEHGAGVERAVQGNHRHGAGARSDHGVTGLALLAFLGAGNTHRDGPHAAVVERGMRFLVERQRADGSLAGDAEFFAALYCHGMATIAVAECLALTGDDALRQPLARAVARTLAMQHPHTGGWRYAAGDRGDTSQCGWQVMVLASARNAGMTGFDVAESRARGFLQSVSSGAAGGLAAYRRGERPTMAMTAEALYCRLLLGMPAGMPAATEALGMIAASPPAATNYNAYTWYYATLASFHAGGPHWEQWNRQLQSALLPLQRRERGPLEGSWDPDPVWGGHGGRVYSTALSAMTLEVYYRHLPMHQREQRMAAVPPSSP
ncbi:MAG: squalene--hopene cyclase [Planctomycetia bacterium]|nr:squalene--hopene cyclase [Planctomycetia bacterium]